MFRSLMFLVTLPKTHAIIISPPPPRNTNTITVITPTPSTLRHHHPNHHRHYIFGIRSEDYLSPFQKSITNSQIPPFLSLINTININTHPTTITSTSSTTVTNPPTQPPPLPWEESLRHLKPMNDEVVRVLDPNTIKIKRNGLVTFAAIQTPSGYKNGAASRYPDCMTSSLSTKVRRLLPSGTRVSLYFVDALAGNQPQQPQQPRAALVVVTQKETLVNVELVRAGFARPIPLSSTLLGVYETSLPGFMETLRTLRDEAKEKGLGMYQRCDTTQTNTGSDNNTDQFEELQYSIQTRWGDDGGVPVRIENKRGSEGNGPPPNPGDVRNCSDFPFYEDALRYYEIYYPYYGDVAKLDRDNDGIPCEGLPHTKNPEKYRVKKSR